MLEGENRTVYWKPEFLFGDATPDTDHQLLAEEGQWVYTLDGECYYLPESKRHYPLALFQSVTMLRVMKWGVRWCTESVHMRVLTLGAFTRSDPPRSIVYIRATSVVKCPWGRIPPKS